MLGRFSVCSSAHSELRNERAVTRMVTNGIKNEVSLEPAKIAEPDTHRVLEPLKSGVEIPCRYMCGCDPVRSVRIDHRDVFDPLIYLAHCGLVFTHSR